MEIKKRISRDELLEGLLDPEYGDLNAMPATIRAFVASIPDEVFEQEFTETFPDPMPDEQRGLWVKDFTASLPDLLPLHLKQKRPLPSTKGKTITFRHFDNLRENPR